MAAINKLIVLTNMIIFSSCYTIGTSVGDMTKCSKYHFEEKVLEKLVRLEHKMELLEEKIKLDMQKFEESDIKRTSNTETLRKQMEAEFESQSRILEEKIEYEMQKFEESDKNRTINTIALQKNMVSELESQSRILEEKMELDMQKLEESDRNRTTLQKNMVTELESQSRILEEKMELDMQKLEESDRNRTTLQKNMVTELESQSRILEEKIELDMQKLEESDRKRTTLQKNMVSELESQSRILEEKIELDMQKFEESDRNRTTLQKNMVTELESQRRELEGVVSNLTVQVENISRKLKIEQDDPFRGYLGCFKDDVARHLKHRLANMGNSITLAKCKQHCKGYKYAGLQAQTHCLCGNQLLNKKYPRVSEAECNLACKGEPKRMCGASWRNSIYRV